MNQARSDGDDAWEGKLVGITSKVLPEERDALYRLAPMLLTTPSRLIRFAVVSLLLRQGAELQKSFKNCIYQNNL